MPELNTVLLEQTMQYILDHPDRHDQSVWVDGDEPTLCCTTACFAGWALILDGMKIEDLEDLVIKPNIWQSTPARPGGVLVSPVLLKAAAVLGLDVDTARQLFWHTHEIDGLQHMVKDLLNGEPLEKRR